MWTEQPKIGRSRENAKLVHKDRFISKMFLKGDSVILVIKMGEEMGTKTEGFTANYIAVGSEDTYMTKMTLENETIGQLDEWLGEMHLFSQAPTFRPGVASTTDLGERPKVSNN